MHLELLLSAAAAGATLGLASAVHCAAMCGPIALAVRVREGAHATVSYSLGRLAAYSVAGALAGGFGRMLRLGPWGAWAEVALALVFAGALLHAGLRLLRPTPPADAGLVTLRTEPRVSRAGRVLARVADDPLLLGAATALLPCGALFSALAASALLGSAGAGALAMAAFAGVTGLAVAGVAQLGALHAAGARLRRAIGLVLVTGAVVVALRPVAALGGPNGAPACHDAHTSAPRADR